MAEAYIVDAVRTPVGQRGGGAAPGPPGRPRRRIAHGRCVERTGIDPGAVEDVVFGCVDTIGAQAGDIARTCWLAAGLPEHVPGTTVDRQCGSSQQAVHFAAQAVMAGINDLVVAGGVQNMSMIPICSAMTARRAARLHRPVHRLARAGSKRYGDAGGQPVPRRRDDRREVGHHPRGHGGVRGRVARRGRSGPSAEGRFEAEIAPLGGLDHDEGPREPNWREDPLAADAASRAGASPPRWRARSATRPPRCSIASRAGGEGPRPHAAGPHPPPERARRRPDLHAHRRRSRPPVTRSRRPA